MSHFASSSSSDSSSVEYEVFISFRGSDTRNAFTSHLHEALSRRKIVTFVDKKIPSGDEISSLFDTIKKSKAAVVIFSKDYASSKWCLNELVKILECNKRHGQIVIPVFYHVNPTDVRKQTGSYGKSFAEHKAKGIPVKTLQNWKDALKEASYLKGYETAVIRDEACLTKKIVDGIWKKLRGTYKTNHKNLVGIESKVEEIISLLKIGSGDACYVGIWGPGGIGKTTLASAVFNEIRTQFSGSCFLKNIRERSGRNGGLDDLRRELYADISGEKSGKLFDDGTLNFYLSRKKVLIVFDDVDDIEQIENIVGEVDIESRVIITARDKQVLRNYANYVCKKGKIYEVNGLCDQEALQLFSRFAFKQEHPEEGYTKLSRKMVDYADGSPLALKVLGSSLFSKNIHVWESAIEQLKRAPNKKIQGVLKVSFDGLDYEQKNVFLDLACFLEERPREYIVNFYNHNIEFTLDTLIDRCLVSLGTYGITYGMITMHDLLHEMGRQIVREESIEYPGKRSRLWDYDDIYQVLMRNQGTSQIKVISLDIPEGKTIHLNKNSFTKMSELRSLIICPFSMKDLRCSKDFQCPSTKLRFLCWDGYPFNSLKSRFSVENLVTLEMRFSKVKQLWDDVQPLPNLKMINLVGSRRLTAMPDLSLAPKLEEVIFSGCGRLTSLPPCNTRKLDLSLTRITRLPSFLNPSQLLSLNLWCCRRLSLSVSESQLAADSVWSDLLSLSNLSNLNLSSCDIVEVPDTICQLSSLKNLNLGSNKFDKLPDMQLSKLERLNVSHCSKLMFLPNLPRSLKYLVAAACSSLRDVPHSLSTLLTTTKDVCFHGCYMLDEDAFTTIEQKALSEIQQRFREGPAQAIENGHAFSDLSCIRYPGCEIPEFFEFQHLGSKISIELSHDMIVGKIVGFAFCVVCKPLQNRVFSPILQFNFRRKITLENGKCFLLPDELGRVPEDCGFVSLPKDECKEVVVGYTHASNYCTFPSEYQSILLELEFSFHSGAGFDYEVEKCGFHLFTGPVSEEEGKGTSSSSSEEKQLERSPKKLKVS